MSARIDGRSVEVREGETILAAARRVGVEIPTLCFAEGLAPEGGCRICVVEVGGQLLGACHTPLAHGMDVVTRSPRLHALRRGLLELLLAERPVGALAPDPDGQRVRAAVARVRRAAGDRRTAPLPRSTTAIPSCASTRAAASSAVAACTRATRSRGSSSTASRGAGPARGSSSAQTSASRTAAASPAAPASTAARPARSATSTGRRPTRVRARVRSTCGYCGVGCQVEIRVAGGEVLAIDGARDAAVNRGHLCVKGRYAHAWRRSPERLTRPLLRDGGELKPVSWEAGHRLGRRDACASCTGAMARMRSAS